MKKTGFLPALWLALFATASGAEALPEVVMHKDPNCGCCGKWAEHLEANGFKVKTVYERDMEAVKKRLGVPQRLTSCHTARVGSYIVEGHVPADSVKRLLREKPEVRGVATPGMPVGSPGMEVPGVKAEAYEVISFDRAGKTRVFERIN